MPNCSYNRNFRRSDRRTTLSSLNAHKSSMKPPPRPTIRTSVNLFLFMKLIALTISNPASSPCTLTGKNTQFYSRTAPLGNCYYIVNSSAGLRSYYTDLLRLSWYFAFPCGRKKAFLFKLSFNFS